VTPPSTLLHFGRQDSLLAAGVRRGNVEKLDEEMHQLAAEQPSTSRRLRAQGLAYVASR